MKCSHQTLSRWSSAAIVESKIRFDQIAVLSLLWIYSTCCWIDEYHELSIRHTPLDYHLSVRFRKMSVFYRESEDMTEQLKGPTSTLVPRARLFFVTQFWQKLSRVGSGARLLGSLSKGVFTWNRGELNPVPRHGSIFVYMIPPQNVMPARVTPAWVHLGCCTGARISLRYEISQRYHVNAKRPPVSVWNRSAGRLERVAHA